MHQQHQRSSSISSIRAPAASVHQQQQQHQCISNISSISASAVQLIQIFSAGPLGSEVVQEVLADLKIICLESPKMQNKHYFLENEVVVGRRYHWGHKDWKAAVTKYRVIPEPKIEDGSQCCRLCREKHPETKVWQKYKLYNICECFTYDDDFDPSEYEKGHGQYSIGSCE